MSVSLRMSRGKTSGKRIRNRMIESWEERKIKETYINVCIILFMTTAQPLQSGMLGPIPEGTRIETDDLIRDVPLKFEGA